MGTEGTYDSQREQGGQGADDADAQWLGRPHEVHGETTRVPRPASPPPMPPLPPRSPAAVFDVRHWLRAHRADAEPGLWRYGYRPRPAGGSAEVPTRALVVGALISIVCGVFAWAVWRTDYIAVQRLPLKLFTPTDWWRGEPGQSARTASAVYNSLFAALLIYFCGRLGNWPALYRRLVLDRPQPGRALAAALTGLLVVWVVLATNLLPFFYAIVHLLIPMSALRGHRETAALLGFAVHALVAGALLWPFARTGGWLQLFRKPDPAVAVEPADMEPETGEDPAGWPQLRAAGQPGAADRLAAEVAGLRMNDVDCARIDHAWSRVEAGALSPGVFVDAVVKQGAAACLHPSGNRDLPVRAATHDLLTAQVKVGVYAEHPRNPAARRGTGAALDPSVLGTSLLAAGPHGSDRTRRLVRPVVESLSLQALAGRAAVVVVSAEGVELGPEDSYDVVVKIGDAASVYDLDLYGGIGDPDEAAMLLAEAFTGDLPDVDSRRAAVTLGQLIGPFNAARSRFPSLPELRELLDGGRQALDLLRGGLHPEEHRSYLREVDARERQLGTSADLSGVLADRIAFLDRPAFSTFFDTRGRSRPFSLRALEHPVRVRIVLPERSHPEASRILTRLVFAQFVSSVGARRDASLFAALVLDDAASAMTTDSVRALQRLRQLNAGAVLAVRSLDDVGPHLHAALLGAVGCLMTFPGITTWEGKRFAEAWGKEWVETREVAQHTVFADQPFTRALHALRKLVTGKAVTTDAVTVRQVERERWSASELAYAVPAGHAVLSLTTVQGEHAPPLLVHLDG
ncbi:ATP/GTP-binding protein [Streptomyces anulatus]|uniref:ATP/GTP-binding protein n=1 Tax=Streptomyces anulatus TaxID=1892 RepID=UPI002253EA75|nr:ATP/GTP-binding protein [Streptomyces anulatus]MCX4488182.1 ATP/GTP-binding protein [Streptomyces anulatus]MCX4521620.1 ATP/GTP-binding protein [Streptomyces anulatus]MCX4604496.1 ATP/GTP-binding protein [Streptomyces anulatus]